MSRFFHHLQLTAELRLEVLVPEAARQLDLRPWGDFQLGEGVGADDPVVFVIEEEDPGLGPPGLAPELEDAVSERLAQMGARLGRPLQRQVDPQEQGQELLRRTEARAELIDEVEHLAAPAMVHDRQHLPPPLGDAHELHPATLRSRLRYWMASAR